MATENSNPNVEQRKISPKDEIEKRKAALRARKQQLEARKAALEAQQISETSNLKDAEIRRRIESKKRELELRRHKLTVEIEKQKALEAQQHNIKMAQMAAATVLASVEIMEPDAVFIGDEEDEEMRAEEERLLAEKAEVERQIEKEQRKKAEKRRRRQKELETVKRRQEEEELARLQQEELALLKRAEEEAEQERLRRQEEAAAQKAKEEEEEAEQERLRRQEEAAAQKAKEEEAEQERLRRQEEAAAQKAKEDEIEQERTVRALALQRKQEEELGLLQKTEEAAALEKRKEEQEQRQKLRREAKAISAERKRQEEALLQRKKELAAERETEKRELLKIFEEQEKKKEEQERRERERIQHEEHLKEQQKLERVNSQREFEEEQRKMSQAMEESILPPPQPQLPPESKSVRKKSTEFAGNILGALQAEVLSKSDVVRPGSLQQRFGARVMTADDNSNHFEAKKACELKVVLIGDAGVGKTNLLLRFTTGKWEPDTQSTIGVAFGVKEYAMGDGNRLKASIWDTAGQEKYKSITRSYYRKAQGAVIIYDVHERESFQHVRDWMGALEDYASSDIHILMVGNKCDLQLGSQAEYVTQEEADLFASENGITHIRTSAKADINVAEAFESVIGSIYQDILDKLSPQVATEGNIKLNEKQSNRRNCC